MERTIYKTILGALALICLLPALAMASIFILENDVAYFTGEGEDFSVEQSVYLCPFDAAAAGTSLYKSLSTLRQVRETVLKQTKVGRKYVELFSLHSRELAQLVLHNPELADGMLDLTKTLLPIADDLLNPNANPDSILLDGSDAVRIKILATKFESKASPALALEIAKGKDSIDGFENKTIAEVHDLLGKKYTARAVGAVKEMIPLELEPMVEAAIEKVEEKLPKK